MAFLTDTTPWRDQFSLARTLRQMADRLHPAPRQTTRINDHIARDIGLTPAELERLHWQAPSQTYRHPHL